MTRFSTKDNCFPHFSSQNKYPKHSKGVNSRVTDIVPNTPFPCQSIVTIISHGFIIQFVAQEIFTNKSLNGTKYKVKPPTGCLMLSISRGGCKFFFFFFFSVRLLSVLCGHSVFSSPPQRPMTSDFEGFSIPDFIHYIYFLILILENEPVFSLLNVQC